MHDPHPGRHPRCETNPETGAAAPEYALLIALVATIIFGTVVLLGATLVELYDSVHWW